MKNIFDENTSLNSVKKQLLDKVLELRSKGTLIQAQPLGMMRLALDGQKNSDNGKFLHYWSSDLPRSPKDVEEFPHTHVFNMISRIIQGRLNDTIYKPQIDPAGDFQLIGAKCTQDSCTLLDNTDRVRMEVSSVTELSSGDIYEVQKGTYHATSFPTSDKVAITVMEKMDAELYNPIISLPYGMSLDKKPFDRMQLNQDAAWDTLISALQ